MGSEMCIRDSSKTTAYHPQSNGMIERQHRIIKDRLISRIHAASSGTQSWLEHLPFVLLGIRTSVREDSQCSPAELLYGGPLRLPGDVLAPSGTPPPASSFVQDLRSVIGSAGPMPVAYHGSQPSRVDPALSGVSHVLLRVDSVRPPLVPPYEGPYKVLGRSSDMKTFTVLKRDKPLVVSIDRLKPAFFLPDSPAPLVPSLPARAVPSSTASPRIPPPARSVPLTPDRPSSRTFSGRLSRPVVRFQA